MINSFLNNFYSHIKIYLLFFILMFSILLKINIHVFILNYFFSFFKDFLPFYLFLLLNSYDNIIFSISFNILDYPIFFFFAFFFFATSIFSLLFSSYIGFTGVFLSNFLSLLGLYVSLNFYIKKIFFENYFFYIKLSKWMFLSSYYQINFDFLIDNVSLSFSYLTVSIAIFVYIYTFSYFRFEPLVDRLLVFLNLFIISMVFLVSSGNLVSLFLGWEMIGMTSFFLINFWSVRIGTFKSAFKAFSFNKFSDLFLFFAIILIFNSYLSLDILTILTSNNFFNLYLNFFFFNISYNDLICCFFLLCAFIKSAQIGGHIWLPDSMEAPVPASALIHSATLVSAGIFILLRFSPLFEYSHLSIYAIALIGSITAFYGGFSSMLQADTKKILAYSTISHCGFLMVVYSTNILEYVLIYLYIHGFFKAAVFMCAGNVNRLSKNNQDFRKMGMFYKYIPFDCYLIFLGLINLSGLPFTLGFYIKHILLISLNSNYFFYYIIFINCIFAALTGIFYSSRLLFYVFFDFKKSKKNLYLYYSNNFLNSKFYSNSSLASNFSIASIFFISYFIGYLLLNNYLSFNHSFSNFFSFYSIDSFFFLNFPNSLNLFNFGYINYFVIFLTIYLFFSHWRYSLIRHKTYDFFFFILTVFFFFSF